MTSKEVQEMINEIEDQIERFGQMNSFKVQLSVLKSYKQDLDRLEVLEEKNQELKEEKLKFRELYEVEKHDKFVLKLENEELKRAIEILKEEPYILEFGLENFTYDKFNNTYYYEVEIQGYDGLDFRNKIYVISKETYDLLKEVLENE